MKTGQLITLFIICGIVLGVGFFVQKKNQQDLVQQTTGVGDKLFPEFPVNEVQRMVITTKENYVELAQDGDTWRVKNHHGYHADFVKIADFLKKVMDLKILQTIEVGKPDYGRLELNDPEKAADTGIRVELFGKTDALIGRFILGKQHMRKREGSAASLFGGGGDYPDGRYVLNTKTATVALVAETFTDVKEKSADWLDKSFVKIEKIKTGVLKEGDAELWRVSREKEADALSLSGEIKDDYEANTGRISSIDNALRYANFKDIADPAQAETFGFDNGKTYTVETFDGIRYTVAIGTKTDDDNYPAKITMAFNPPPLPAGADDEKPEDKAVREQAHKVKLATAKETYETESTRYRDWVYLLPSYTINSLVVERDELIKKKVEPISSSDSTSSDATLDNKVTPPTPPPLIPTPLLLPETTKKVEGVLEKATKAAEETVNETLNKAIDNAVEAVETSVERVEGSFKELQETEDSSMPEGSNTATPIE